MGKLTKLNSEVEEQLIARILRDRKFFTQCQSLVKKDVHLENQIYRDLYEIASSYNTKYTDSLTIEVMKNEVKKMIESLHSNEKEDFRTKKLDFYFENVDKLYSLDISNGEQYTLDMVIDYTKRRSLRMFFVRRLRKYMIGVSPLILAQSLQKWLRWKR